MLYTVTLRITLRYAAVDPRSADAFCKRCHRTAPLTPRSHWHCCSSSGRTERCSGGNEETQTPFNSSPLHWETKTRRAVKALKSGASGASTRARAASSLGAYENLAAKGGKAPAGWQFNDKAWWLEEHGLIMEEPAPLPPGRYVVTGARKVTTELTVQKNGDWSLKEGKLFDVTHLPCRSALYTPGGGTCTPAQANPEGLPRDARRRNAGRHWREAGLCRALRSGGGRQGREL